MANQLFYEGRIRHSEVARKLAAEHRITRHETAGDFMSDDAVEYRTQQGYFPDEAVQTAWYGVARHINDGKIWESMYVYLGFCLVIEYFSTEWRTVLKLFSSLVQHGRMGGDRIQPEDIGILSIYSGWILENDCIGVDVLWFSPSLCSSEQVAQVDEGWSNSGWTRTIGFDC